MKLENQTIIIIFPFLEFSSENQSFEFIFNLVKNNKIFMLYDIKIISLFSVFKKLFKKERLKNFYQLLKKRGNKLFFFFPIGIFPFQRFYFIATINHFFFWTFFNSLLVKEINKGRRPILWLFPSIFKYNEKFHYFGGIFKEKLSIFDCVKKDYLKKKLKRDQTNLIKKVDIVLVYSKEDFRIGKRLCFQTYLVPSQKELKLKAINKLLIEIL